MREVRVDLPRDVTILAGAAVPHRAEQVARVLDVVLRQVEEDLLGVGQLLEALAQLLVVGVALRDRLLEDRRVRRDPGDRVLVHHPRELAALEQLPREVVDPNALAEGLELVQVRVRHSSSHLPSP